VQSQASQRDQTVGTRQTSKCRNQPKCSPLPHLLHTPAVHFPSSPSFGTALPYLTPAFFQKDERAMFGNFRGESFVSACNKCISHDTPTLFFVVLFRCQSVWSSDDLSQLCVCVYIRMCTHTHTDKFSNNLEVLFWRFNKWPFDCKCHNPRLLWQGLNPTQNSNQWQPAISTVINPNNSLKQSASALTNYHSHNQNFYRPHSFIVLFKASCMSQF